MTSGTTVPDATIGGGTNLSWLSLFLAICRYSRFTRGVLNLFSFMYIRTDTHVSEVRTK